MSRYSLKLKPSAAKELDALSDALFARIDSKIMALADQWRIRVGDYRVVYSIDDARLLVEVTRVRHRSEVYEP